MSSERERILKMVADAKITVNEAEVLLDALEGKGENSATVVAPQKDKKQARFMYVKVTSAQNDNVDVKVPLGLLRAGLKFTSLIPPQAMEKINQSMSEKGIAIDLNNLKKDDLEELINGLTEMEVNVNSKNGDNVRVYCE